MLFHAACGSETGSTLTPAASVAAEEGAHEHSREAMSEQGGHEMHEHNMAMDDNKDGAATNGFDGMSKPGTTARCPVMNRDFEVAADSPHSEYNGKTYIFCCAGCKPQFDADPKKFVDK
jgi:YHS domain-containing protein